MCQQANIVGRKIVVHSGNEQAIFGSQALRVPDWARRVDMYSGIQTVTVLFKATMVYVAVSCMQNNVI